MKKSYVLFRIKLDSDIFKLLEQRCKRLKCSKDFYVHNAIINKLLESELYALLPSDDNR